MQYGAPKFLANFTLELCTIWGFSSPWRLFCGRRFIFYIIYILYIILSACGAVLLVMLHLELLRDQDDVPLCNNLFKVSLSPYLVPMLSDYIVSNGLDKVFC